MPPTLSPVLCAIDLSDQSEEVLAHAMRLGAALGSPVHVVLALEPPDPMSRMMIASAVGADQLQAHEAAALAAQRTLVDQRLAAFAARQPSGPEASELFAASHIERGRPALAILATAERVGAGLVVAGLRGHRALEHLMVGSVAQQLVQRCAVPLMLVPVTNQEG